ncbi:hypothetical protein BN2537_17049 [Streptomyces venezuelae]|nr:hypothetical protein BN2537_17049 [Streptomyces venezuelae]
MGPGTARSPAACAPCPDRRPRRTQTRHLGAASRNELLFRRAGSHQPAPDH